MKTSLPLPHSLTVELIDNDADFEALSPEWNALQDRSANPSLFATFDYVSLAWQHARQPGDRLLILLVRHEGHLHAIAPLQVSRSTYHGLPIRRIEWIAAWEGDRPGMLCDSDPAPAWSRIQQYLASDYLEWDIAVFIEQSPTQQDADDLLARISLFDHELDSDGYYISLTGSFDQYLAGIDAKVRANWRNRARRLAAMVPTPELVSLTTPAQMAEGVRRLIALERTSWKNEAGLGLGKDASHRAFYLALTEKLAAKGQAEFHFLEQNGEDLAGTLLFRQGTIVYERHIAYAPSHANLSPGIVLRTQVMEKLFGTDCTEFDLMGMHPQKGRQRHKVDWATGQRNTECLRYVRRRGRLAVLWRAAKTVRHLLRQGQAETA